MQDSQVNPTPYEVPASYNAKAIMERVHAYLKSVHPQFHWARANVWAVMAMVELLDVLLKKHAGYADVVIQLQSHVNGQAHFQDSSGFWHQLLDRNDTYLENSATAIFTYSIARAINLILIDPYAYAQVFILGWNAVATKIN